MNLLPWRSQWENSEAFPTGCICADILCYNTNSLIAHLRKKHPLRWIYELWPLLYKAEVLHCKSTGEWWDCNSRAAPVGEYPEVCHSLEVSQVTTYGLCEPFYRGSLRSHPPLFFSKGLGNILAGALGLCFSSLGQTWFASLAGWTSSASCTLLSSPKHSPDITYICHISPQLLFLYTFFK